MVLLTQFERRADSLIFPFTLLLSDLPALCPSRTQHVILRSAATKNLSSKRVWSPALAGTVLLTQFKRRADSLIFPFTLLLSGLPALRPPRTQHVILRSAATKNLSSKRVWSPALAGTVLLTQFERRADSLIFPFTLLLSGLPALGPPRTQWRLPVPEHRQGAPAGGGGARSPMPPGARSPTSSCRRAAIPKHIRF
jgi:hypothetical protein